jgi:hypothetical protein
MEMTMTSIEIFDSKGHVRTDYDPAEIAALSPDRRKRHAKLVAAATEAQAAEAALKSATDAMHAAVRDHQNATADFERIKPRPRFHDLWRETFKG